ncbi:MAG: hypothetical protein NUV50_13335 [Rhodospirillales bacterium]|nr:hypothetical protein [Rhodospirillales bacterium]
MHHNGYVTVTFLIAIVLSALFTKATPAQEMNHKWIATANNPDCTFWASYDKEMTEEKMTWSGTCLNGHVHGPGRLTSSHSYFEGTFREGKLQGHAVLDGIRMKGEGSLAGHFEGEMENGIIHGHGAFDANMMRNGEPMRLSYKGEFNDGVFHGRGDITLEKKTTHLAYRGNFKNGTFDGQGSLTIESENEHITYVGKFKDDAFHGQGVIEVKGPVQYRYEGEFQRNDKHGNGVQEFSDGSQYAGEFNNGWKHGHGVATLANGNTCTGEWKEDVLIGAGEGLIKGRSVKCYADGTAIKFAD